MAEIDMCGDEHCILWNRLGVCTNIGYGIAWQKGVTTTNNNGNYGHASMYNYIATDGNAGRTHILRNPEKNPRVVRVLHLPPHGWCLVLVVQHANGYLYM